MSGEIRGSLIVCHPTFGLSVMECAEYFGVQVSPSFQQLEPDDFGVLRCPVCGNHNGGKAWPNHRSQTREIEWRKKWLSRHS